MSDENNTTFEYRLRNRRLFPISVRRSPSAGGCDSRAAPRQPRVFWCQHPASRVADHQLRTLWRQEIASYPVNVNALRNHSFCDRAITDDIVRFSSGARSIHRVAPLRHTARATNAAICLLPRAVCINFPRSCMRSLGIPSLVFLDFRNVSTTQLKSCKTLNWFSVILILVVLVNSTAHHNNKSGFELGLKIVTIINLTFFWTTSVR